MRLLIHPRGDGIEVIKHDTGHSIFFQAPGLSEEFPTMPHPDICGPENLSEEKRSMFVFEAWIIAKRHAYLANQPSSPGDA